MISVDLDMPGALRRASLAAIALAVWGCQHFYVEVPPSASACIRDCQEPYHQCEVDCAVLEGEAFAVCHDGCNHDKYECASKCPGARRRFGSRIPDVVHEVYVPEQTPIPRFPGALPPETLRH